VAPDSCSHPGLALELADDTVENLRRLVERDHRCIARPANRALVWEVLGGEIVGEYTVHPFDLQGHPAMLAAYAWYSGALSFVVLHEGAVCGPAEAVSAVLRVGPFGMRRSP
jgi:hypothetical protein